MLLAIDTSAGTSVAVVDRERGVLAERLEPDTRRHAEVVGQLIADVLAEAGVDTAELSAVAVGMGPGPFTGLRVGIAAGQAFALGSGRPVVRVISHDAIAYDHYRSGNAGPLLVVTDARRREVYWSTYEAPAAEHPRDAVPPRTAPPGLCRPDELGGVVPDYDRYQRVNAATVSAGALGMLAETMFATGVPFAGPEPLYLRSPDVTVPAGPKRVS